MCSSAGAAQSAFMICAWPSHRQQKLIPLYASLLAFSVLPSSAAEPSAAALAAFNDYARSVESRLLIQHRSSATFLALPFANPQSQAVLRRGELIIERIPIATDVQLPDAALYHWRDTAFAPGATVADFEQLMSNFDSYPQTFAPQVLSAHVLGRQGDHLRVTLRIRQHHVVTVVLDTDYDITFSRLDAHHGYSFSRSNHIAEIAAPGTPQEHVLDATHEHGFLWRQDTWWSYEQRDGGLYMQVESVSLTRAIPTGLGWAIGPYVESIPRESLEFTLRAACNALPKRSAPDDPRRHIASVEKERH